MRDAGAFVPGIHATAGVPREFVLLRVAVGGSELQLSPIGNYLEIGALQGGRAPQLDLLRLSLVHSETSENSYMTAASGGQVGRFSSALKC
jgi:hypothetical protein